MNTDVVTEDREKTTAILLVALVLSLVAHLGLMQALEHCSFNTVPDGVRPVRRWTRDMPLANVTRHTGDPMADTAVTGRPAAAPEAETVAARVARLGEKPLAEMAATPAVAAPAAPAPSAPPPEVAPAEWRLQETIAVLDHPLPAEEAAPQLVRPLPEAPASAGADILPPAELLAHESAPAAAPAGDASTPALGFPSLAPPPADLAVGAGALAFGSGALARAATATAVAAPDETPPPPPDPPREAARSVLPRVDERVVQEAQQAVKDLRDTASAQPFAARVTCTLDHWIDPAHRDFRYFRLRLAARTDPALEVVPKDVVYLLDASGSIGNDRLKACRKAVRAALDTLNSHDRFNLVAFRDKYTYLFAEWRAVDVRSLKAADEWLANLAAHGRTDVFASIRSVLTLPRAAARPLIACVVTDGEATSGLTRSTRIISSFSELNDGLVALYMYGVKEKANSYLMDLLTRENRGAWSRHTGMRWRAASGLPQLTAQFARPVLTDVAVTFAAASQAEAYPRRPTHLYLDGPIELYGVCPASVKELAFAVRGLNGAKACQDVFKLAFKPSDTLTSAVKQTWAQYRIYAALGDYVRRPDPQTRRDIELFARHYQVAVPYEAELGRDNVSK